jgi:uncharacterized protein YqfA (UPF0365 family)
MIVGVILKPWAMAVAGGVRVGVPHLLGMRIRGTPPELIIAALVIDQKRGGGQSLLSLETAYLANPDPRRTAAELLAIADHEVVTRSPSAARFPSRSVEKGAGRRPDR